VTNDRTFVKDASHFTLHDGTTMDVDSKMKRGRPDNVEKKTEINTRIHTYKQGSFPLQRERLGTAFTKLF